MDLKEAFEALCYMPEVKRFQKKYVVYNVFGFYVSDNYRLLLIMVDEPNKLSRLEYGNRSITINHEEAKRFKKLFQIYDSINKEQEQMELKLQALFGRFKNKFV